MMHHELEKYLPANRIMTKLSEREAFAGDKWMKGPTPDVVVRPRTTAEVAAVMCFAHERAIPVTTRGAGWGYVGGAVSNSGGICLSLDAMHSIREVSREDFVAVVEAGVVTADLQRAAREMGLFYPPDPASSAYCTLGGNIATNAGGARCLKYGVTRNYVLGLEVVTADGTIFHLGGRTHKNKTGFDLLGLFVGSEGMLGIVTGATLKLLPAPPARRAIAAVFAAISQAANAVGAIFDAGVLPAALEIADEATFAHFLAQHGLPPQRGAHVLIEVDGQIESARAEIAEIKAVLRAVGAWDIEVADSEIEVESLWETRRQFSASLSASGKRKLNEDIVVPRGKLVELVEFARVLGEKHGVEVACFGHAGDGNIHVNLLLDSAQLERAEAILDELFAQILTWGGAITGEHGIGLAKKRWWPSAASPEVRALHQTVKAALDPKGILNPGKWL
ncbi:MAG: FAD-binding protein [Armatimonadetes bacterium]|nr:FAD-binding protein [Armatimonadota bacterium]